MAAIKNELTPLILTKEIMDQKNQLKSILSKYGVNEPEEIEKKIESGELPEHPPYEDFLSALSLKSNIQEMKKLVGKYIEGI